MATLISSEFLINDTTDFLETSPQVAIDGQGNFVVVWSGTDLADPLDQRIFFRRFSATANDLDNNDVEVTTTTQGDRLSDPAVAMTDDSRFVVVWENDADAGEGTELNIAAQLYEADGDADGDAFSITTDLTSSNFNPDVAINRTTGDFVVTWIELDEDGDRSLLARRFDSDGEALGDEDIIVEEIDADDITEGERIDDPAIAIDASGNFIITWIQDLNNNNDNGLDIYARLYDSSGTPLAPAFVVNNEQEQTQFRPDIAADADGNFTIVWQSDLIEQVGPDRNPGIFARRFNNSGTGFADEFTVSAPDSDERTESNPAIGTDSNGNTLITWTSLEVDGDTGLDIFAQQYDPAGTAVDSPFQVNADDQEDGNQTNAAVAIDPDGDAVVVFQGDLQSSDATPGDQDLFGQQVDLTDGTPPPTTDEPTDPGTGVDGADLVGTPERDVLIGDDDNNTISGQGGNDVLQGQGGADIINGDAGNDTISGGNGDDQLFGDSGRDRILGNSGADDIEGSGGGDILRGGRGNDFLRAGAGSDRLVGGEGDDCLNGGGGNDRLIGGAGTNILNGSSGRDLLIGRGSGADTFVLLTNSGFDTIRNFDPTQDSLGVASDLLAQRVEFRITNTGSIVRLDGQNVALVRGVDLSNVALDNILTVVTAEQIACEPSVS